jgi:predicted KAP-like P-loop ATPase
LDSQEDFLIKENKKHVKVKNAYAREVEKCEKLTSELSTCHDIISNLRNDNTKLIAKVEKLDVCDDSIVSLRNDNVKRPDPLGLKCYTITSPRRLVITFLQIVTESE